jgi:hypothetical protein
MFVTRSHDRPAGPRRAFLVPRETTGPRRRGRPWRRAIYGLLAALLAAGLTTAVAPGAATAATRADHAITAGHTIATAKTLSLAKKTSGGGGPIDFWKVTLFGGDQLQIVAKTPNSGCCGSYHFELYRPGTTDATFPQLPPVTAGNTSSGGTGGVIVLQAPYNGTYVLAVCESPPGDCRTVDSGGGDNPMGLYSFTATLVNGGVNPKVGAEETQASPTIAKAAVTPVGHFEAGGGNGIDFWKVPLLGGDQVQLSVQTVDSGCCGSYHFELYQPGTNDTNFPQRPPVMATFTSSGSTQSTLILQAPYNGTFVLAVCESPSGDCRNVDSGGGDNPMGPYTFTPTLVNGGVNPKVGAKETRATATIAKAAVTTVGNFEAGGGNGIDFWKVPLKKGNQVQVVAQMPFSGCCGSYHFELYKPGTTDTTFPQHAPVSAAVTSSGSTQATLVLKAPATGTFILAVCESPSGDCRNVDSGGGDNPMGVYTFTPTLVKGGTRS